MSSAATIRMCHCGVAHAEGIPCDQVMVATDMASIRLTFSERLSFWRRNFPSWPTALAVWYLSRRLQRDKAFRDAWHANIAMPIYDATRPPCACVIDFEVGKPWHEPGCPQWESAIRGDLHGMSGAQANRIADRLMEHLFGA